MLISDTSALAKLYVPEPQSAAVRKVFEAEDQVFASELARVEIMAVLHRRLREKKWTQAEFTTAIRQFERDNVAGIWTWLPVDAQILAGASSIYTTLPDSVFLRSADCIHLLTALHHRFAEVYSYDAHQAAAAIHLGLVIKTA
jgi:predicted nucleic acid-binding protein